MKQISYKHELVRKSFHMLGLVIPISYVWLELATILAILLPITIIITIADLCKHRFPAIAKLYFGIFGSILRPHEREVSGLSGATPLFIAATASIALFSKPVAIAAIATLIISDSCAAIIGRKWGTHPFLGKSVEGTVAFTLSAWLVVLVVGLLCDTAKAFYMAGIIAAPIAALVEVLSGKINIDDNFSIPISMGIVMTAYLYLAAA